MFSDKRINHLCLSCQVPLWKLLLISLKKELSFAKDSVELVVSIVRFSIFSPKFEVTLLQYLSNKAFIYIYKLQNLVCVKQCSIHRSRAEYIYCAKEKTNKLQVHPYRPVSWSPTYQGI